MLILAFDTTSEFGGAAVFHDQSCLAQAHQEGQPSYSVSLFKLVSAALEEAAVALREIDLFAAATGPGSFTGIRAGLAAALGWSRAFEKPCLGVSIFEAMAEESAADTEWVLPLLDAHRGEFYAELLRRPEPRSAGPRTALEPQGGGGWVLGPGPLSSMLESRVPEGAMVTCITREKDTPAAALQAFLPPFCRWQTVSGFLVPAVARVAFRTIQQGGPQPAAALSAHYVRRTDAELKLKV
ncbi:MAG: tRNA (adenosine(37)-N6)-threonylcarbamoyltransferase complex dimerization subunit type 1 TsaB [Terracidiphilus sp.]